MSTKAACATREALTQQSIVLLQGADAGGLLLREALQRLHLVLQLHDVPQLARLGSLSALQESLRFRSPQGVLQASGAWSAAAQAPLLSERCQHRLLCLSSNVRPTQAA